MSSERQDYTEKPFKKTLKRAAQSMAVAGVLLNPTVAFASDLQSENIQPAVGINSPSISKTDAGDIYPSVRETGEKDVLSRDERLHEFLEDEYARAVLVAGCAAAIAAGVNAHLLGKKHDERVLHRLRVAGPTLMAASMATLGIDSYTTIDRHIPASLFLGATLTMAAYNVISAFERESDSKIRASAVAASTMLFVSGTALFLLVDKA